MSIRLPGMVQAKALLRRSLLPSAPTVNVPKGHFAVYVGDQAQKKRFIVPICYLTNPSFQDLLGLAEEEFGFNHPMGGLTIPCKEDQFLDLASRLSG
uniref:Auxin-responsive protein SAUR21-like n=1 Tax=Nelumbo nucifera TaxID=4432 RepID=A0A822Z797_NELNU|nr:TPA_asm: hypothetical protein HUJ06_014813 [Nelumbo nucifera]